MNKVETKIEDLDLKKLTDEQARDLKEIEVLTKRIEDKQADLTINDISLHNIKMKPDLGCSEESPQYMNGLLSEIEKYQKKLELLEVKMQFKRDLMEYQ